MCCTAPAAACSGLQQRRLLCSAVYRAARRKEGEGLPLLAAFLPLPRRTWLAGKRTAQQCTAAAARRSRRRGRSTPPEPHSPCILTSDDPTWRRDKFGSTEVDDFSPSSVEFQYERSETSWRLYCAPSTAVRTGKCRASELYVLWAITCRILQRAYGLRCLQ